MIRPATLQRTEHLRSTVEQSVLSLGYVSNFDGVPSRSRTWGFNVTLRLLCRSGVVLAEYIHPGRNAFQFKKSSMVVELLTQVMRSFFDAGYLGALASGSTLFLAASLTPDPLPPLLDFSVAVLVCLRL